MEEWQRYQKCERRRADAKAAIKRGVWTLVIVAAIEVAMIALVSSAGGNRILVFWGAVAFGGFNLLGGLIRLGPACRQPAIPYQQALAYAQPTQQWTQQQAAAWQAQQTAQWQPVQPPPQQPLPVAYYPPPPPVKPKRNPVAAFFKFLFNLIVFALVFIIVVIIGLFVFDAVTGGSLSR